MSREEIEYIMYMYSIYKGNREVVRVLIEKLVGSSIDKNMCRGYK